MNREGVRLILGLVLSLLGLLALSTSIAGGSGINLDISDPSTSVRLGIRQNGDGSTATNSPQFANLARNLYLPLVLRDSSGGPGPAPTTAPSPTATTAPASTNTPPAPTAPNAPTNLAMTMVSSSSVALQWTDNSNDEDGFSVEKASGGSYSVVGTTTQNTYSVTGLAASTAFTFRVRAYKGTLFSAYSNVLSAQTPAAPAQIAPPSNLVVTSSAPDLTTLTWSDNSNNEDEFGIDLSTDKGASWTVDYGATGAPDVTSVDDNGRTAATQYCYRVRARKGTAYSSYSNMGCVTTATLTAPTAPINVHATINSSTEILLTWTNTSGSTGSDGFAYYIYESDNSGPFTNVGTVPGYHDSGAFIPGSYIGGHTYTYKVTAHNIFGTSNIALSVPSNTVTMPSGSQTTSTIFQNNAAYPVISLTIDGVEQFPSAPQAIPPGAKYQKALTPESHTYTAWTGFWDGSSRFQMYSYSGSFTQQSGVTGNVTIANPTIGQLLTRFGTSGLWVGQYWVGTSLHYAAFRFNSTGGYTFYNDGAVAGSGTYSLVSYPGTFTVTFSTGSYQGSLDEMRGYFFMQNGPSDWRWIEYSYDGP